MFTRALLIAGACFLLAAAPAPLAGEPAGGKNGPETLATASRVSGTVEFCRSGASAFAALTQDGKLFKGDTVRTGKDSSVELKLVDQTHLSLGEESTLVLREVRGKTQADRTLLDLDEGQLGAAVEKLGERQRFEISTPVAVCGVRGTRLAIGHINPKGGRTDKNRGKSTLTVGAGKVNAKCRNPIFAGQGGVDVDKGKRVIITWDGIGKLEDVGISNFKALMKTLPGWHPDPADPNLGKLQVFIPPTGGRLAGLGGKGGTGAYDRGSRGFSNGIESAILGKLGLRNSGRGSGGQGSGGSGGNSDTVFGSAPGGSDPVLPSLVRPGQPTEPPPPVGAGPEPN